MLGVAGFPLALDNAATLFEARDRARTTLSALISDTATTISVLSTASFPNSGSAVIESEVFYYTSKTVGSFQGVTRGAEGSTAVSHPLGAEVAIKHTARHHNVLVDAISATQTKLGIGASTPATGQFLKGTAVGTSAWGALTSAEVTGALGYTPLRPSNNLSDLSNASLARTSLGLGSLAVLSAITGSMVTTALGYAPLNPASNLSDISNPATARSSLGLGSLAVLSAITGVMVTAALGYTPLAPASNLSELTNAAAARGNLGLGSLSTLSALTSTLVTTGLGFTPLRPSNNLSELSDIASARSNLGLGALAVLSSVTSSMVTGALGYTPVNVASVSPTSDVTLGSLTLNGGLSVGGSLSVNAISATSDVYSNGSLRALGHAAFGNTAIVDGPYGANETITVLNMRETITLPQGRNSSGIGFAGKHYGAIAYLALDPTGDFVGGSPDTIALQSYLETTSGNSHTFHELMGVYGIVWHYGTGAVSKIRGSRGEVSNRSTAIVGSGIGAEGQVVNAGGGTITTGYSFIGTVNNLTGGTMPGMYGGVFNLTNQGTATSIYGVNTKLTLSAGSTTGVGCGLITGLTIASATNVSGAYGLYVSAPNGLGTVTNNYGIYIEDHSGKGSTSHFNIDSVGTLSKNRFAGEIISTRTAGAPFSVASNILVTNLNADLLDGFDSAAFVLASGLNAAIDARGVSTNTASRLVSRDASGNFSAGSISVTGFTNSALNTGSVLFAGAGGLITQDSTKLFWDNASKYLGIGTAVPLAVAHIYSNTTNPQMIMESGSGVSSALELRDGNSTQNKMRFGMGATSTTDGKFFIYDARRAAFRTVWDVNGNVGIGSLTSPTAALHIKAGVATSGGAPLKLTAGTNLTTPENGAIEFDGTNLYITVGGVRKTFTLV